MVRMFERQERQGVRIVRMAHGKANAIDVEFFDGLMAELDAAEADPACRGLVLTGRDRIFSAGVDLRRVLAEDEAYLERFVPLIGRGLGRVFRSPLPLVAALNGHAVAGGCILACACDRRIAAAGGATVGVPELKVGVPYPSAALEILRFVTGDRRLQEAVLLAGTTGLEEALRLGLVDEIVPLDRLLDRAVEVAAGLASIDRATYALSKHQVRSPVLERIVSPAAAAADAEVARIWRSPSTRRAIQAYVDKTLGGE